MAATTSDQGQEPMSLTEEEKRAQQEEYRKYLRLARTEDLSDIAALEAFYRSGEDYLGRQIVVFVGNKFPAPKVNLSKAKAYFIYIMETVADEDFIIVYFNTQCQSDRLPDSSFFKEVYNMVDSKYKIHLKAIYIVHAGWWFKQQAWWFLTFIGKEIKERIHYLTGVQYLFDSINPNQIEIPEFVVDHDTKVNGSNYHTPCIRGDEASGGL